MSDAAEATKKKEGFFAGVKKEFKKITKRLSSREGLLEKHLM